MKAGASALSWKPDGFAAAPLAGACGLAGGCEGCPSFLSAFVLLPAGRAAFTTSAPNTALIKSSTSDEFPAAPVTFSFPSDSATLAFGCGVSLAAGRAFTASVVGGLLNAGTMEGVAAFREPAATTGCPVNAAFRSAMRACRAIHSNRLCFVPSKPICVAYASTAWSVGSVMSSTSACEGVGLVSILKVETDCAFPIMGMGGTGERSDNPIGRRSDSLVVEVFVEVIELAEGEAGAFIVVGVSLVSTLVPHVEQKRAFGGNIVRQLVHDFPNSFWVFFLIQSEDTGTVKSASIGNESK
mmetsp:Transcript_26979/g.48561  ORF Transcript_26979/g.48561 Transcript_26979/m.48561 type:complete len:298 (+) Transcript_26979:2720-3613(+)